MEFPDIRPGHPALVLAPMEGVTDAPMRSLLTERGGFGFCVSEFLRINHELLPDSVFVEHVPELKNACRTPTGTPIQVQLLGGGEEMMGLSARKAVQLGARAIDINFGCPSRTVNSHDGGAALLRYPSRIQSIVAAVRKSVPPEIPVSAKLRLGWESREDIHENAERAMLGGASWLTIHARTKAQGYAPPVDWKIIGDVKRKLKVPIVANGDIWSRTDFLRCQELTECEHFMLGRGALANPALVHQVAQEMGLAVRSEFLIFSQHPKDWYPLLLRFSELSQPVAGKSHYTLARIKQWLKLASIQHSLPWFNEIKRTKSLDEMFTLIQGLSNSF